MSVPEPHQPSVVSLDKSQADAAAALIGRAFQDDPLFTHACPDAHERARWLPWAARAVLWSGFYFGQTLGTPGLLAGVVITTHSGSAEFAPEQWACLDYERGRAELGPASWDSAMERFAAAFAPAHAVLQGAISEPHWYLDAIAVEPSQQGRGIGGRLIAAASARADHDGVPIALFTFQPRNVLLYQHHGYAVIADGEAPGDLHWWGMRRDPTQGDGHGQHVPAR